MWTDDDFDLDADDAAADALNSLFDDDEDDEDDEDYDLEIELP